MSVLANDKSIITLKESWKLPQHQKWRWNDKKGVKNYRRKHPGSKLKTAVTGKVKPGSKAAKSKSFAHAAKMDRKEGRAAEVGGMLKTYKFNSYH